MNKEKIDRASGKLESGIFEICFTIVNFLIYVGLYIWCNYTIISKNKELLGRINKGLSTISDDLKNPTIFVISVIVIQAIFLLILNYILLRVVIGLCKSNEIKRQKTLNDILLSKAISLFFVIISYDIFSITIHSKASLAVKIISNLIYCVGLYTLISKEINIDYKKRAILLFIVIFLIGLF